MRVDSTAASPVAASITWYPAPSKQFRRNLRTAGSSSTITFVDLPDDDPKVRQPDITRAREILDWAPQVDRGEGLRRTLDYFRSRVAAADAFVFVMPEYNAGPSPAFVNALCYLHKEWHHKPCGFVSYGGVSGGLRAVQLCKQIVTTLKLVPLIEGVPIPTVAERLDAEGRFVSNPLIDASARAMLPELERWSQALKPMRASGSEGQATR